MIFKINYNKDIYEYIDASSIYKISCYSMGYHYHNSNPVIKDEFIEFIIYSNYSNIPIKLYTKIINNDTNLKLDEEKIINEFKNNYEELIKWWTLYKSGSIGSSYKSRDFNFFTYNKQIEKEEIKEFNKEEIVNGINLIKKNIDDKN